jgi:hypothetical protein
LSAAIALTLNTKSTKQKLKPRILLFPFFIYTAEEKQKHGTLCVYRGALFTMYFQRKKNIFFPDWRRRRWRILRTEQKGTKKNIFPIAFPMNHQSSSERESSFYIFFMCIFWNLCTLIHKCC